MRLDLPFLPAVLARPGHLQHRAALGDRWDLRDQVVLGRPAPPAGRQVPVLLGGREFLVAPAAPAGLLGIHLEGLVDPVDLASQEVPSEGRGDKGMTHRDGLHAHRMEGDGGVFPCSCDVYLHAFGLWFYSRFNCCVREVVT